MVTATAALKRMYIDGKWSDADNGRTLGVINPATEEVIADIAYGGRAEARRAVEAAARAMPAWMKRTAWERAKVLKKTAINPSPLVARANAYIGMPDWTGYTIQADIMGSKVEHDLPDMGVCANRYSLTLWGNTQQLRLTSWDAIPRVDKSIGYPWKEGVWYRMRLTVDVSDGKALVRGKVWPRSEKEPAKWTIEFTDPTPNREGSPAVYGYATGILENSPGSECFFGNVKITPNK